MHKSAYWLLAAILVLGTIGCRGMSGPRLAGPGPASYQRALAEQFDPYPENESAPPVVGGRPRDFQHPIPETQRIQWAPCPQ